MAQGDKPAVLQDQKFTVHEGWLYRFLRGGSIQLNKLMFGALILLVIWLLSSLVFGQEGCTQIANIVDDGNGTMVDDGTKEQCSVWLSPTTKYLGSMAVLSFIGSILFGLVGLTVGKNVLAMTPSSEEVGAQREDQEPEPDSKD